MTETAGSPAGLLRGIAETFGVKVAAAALGLVSAGVIARALGPDGRGAFIAAATLAGLGVQLANLGLQTANTYYLAQDRSRLSTIIANSLLVAIVGGLLAGIVVIACAWALNATATLEAGLIPLAIVAIPIGLASMFLSQLLVAVGQVRLFNQMEIAGRAGVIVASLAVVAAGLAGPSTLYLASIAVQVAVVWVVVRAFGQPLSTYAGSASLGLLREQIPLGMRAYYSALLASLVLRSDLLLVQSISGNAETGYYSIAVAMADVVYMLPTAAGLLLYPRFTAMTDRAARRREALGMAALTAVATAGLGLIAVMAAEPAVEFVFGPDFLPAVPMFHILAIAIVIFGTNTIVSVLLAAEGMPWITVWSWGVGLAVNFILNLALIPEHGGIGAAIASIFGYGAVLVIQLAAVLRAARDEA